MFTSMMKKGNTDSLIKISKKFFGKNEKQIKMRIKSISSIEKITKAMKMVEFNNLGGCQ